MKRSRTLILKAGLNGLYAAGAHKWLGHMTCGMGVIFTLHHVRPDPVPAFAPNRILDITPTFLDQTIARIKRAGIDVVSLDEVHRRLTGEGPSRRFVAFTLDDGYQDNADHAAPVFRAHQCPFTIFVTTSLAEGRMEMWWHGLEAVIAGNDRLLIDLGEGAIDLPSATTEQKYAAYERIYWWLRSLDEDSKLTAVRALCRRYNVDMHDMAVAAGMRWDAISAIAEDPLCTIGAHTVSHPALARLNQARMREEIVQGTDILAAKLGQRPDFLAYPYGDLGSAGPREFDAARELGFKLAVTTRPDVIQATDRDRLMALPRVSLNGDYQSGRYVDLFLSGVPFALFNRLGLAA